MSKTPSFTPQQTKSVVALVRKYGASGTQRILAAKNDSDDATLRPYGVFPDPKQVSISTICRYAKEGGVQLYKGRPKKAQ